MLCFQITCLSYLSLFLSVDPLKHVLLLRSTGLLITQIFKSEGIQQPMVFSSTDELTLQFHSACLNIMDHVAPVKTRHSKPRSEKAVNTQALISPPAHVLSIGSSCLAVFDKL
ncbi:hypothetical protein GOODEAATRI_007130 [Goodea atripinnis]|uniref:Uncharacterized protein n=1 Tax=Goodea atripinnis TaxID=208336 RepID=A0ABV0NSF1_9TELE